MVAEVGVEPNSSKRPSARLLHSPDAGRIVIVAEWRNWQTHQTQNLAFFTERVGSTPTSATIFGSTRY
jgi:hypothetical protein